MSPSNKKLPLEHEHTQQSIEARLNLSHQHSGMGDFVLGAVDGAVTTFAIVAGVAGAELPIGVAVVLGIANVVADGFSMAAGNYLKARSDQQNVLRYREIEKRHIEDVPEGEREEVRQIFALKGFEGDTLEQIVETITADQNRWIDTMLTEEWGLSLHPPSPVRSGTITFVAFMLAGFIPLLPLLFSQWIPGHITLIISAIATAFTFILIGAMRGWLAKQSMLLAAIETLFIGGTAASLAYFVGAFLRQAMQAPVL